MNIQGIIFDLDDTLLVEEASAKKAFILACGLANDEYGILPEDLHRILRTKARQIWHNSPAREYCVSVGISSWEGLWCKFEGDDENLAIMRKWAPFYKKQSWLEALSSFGIEDEQLAELSALKYEQERQKIHTLFTDALPVLESFQNKYKLGLLTNGAADIQQMKIYGARIEKYFDCIVIAGKVGFGKPDLRIFELIAECMKLEPEKIMMIGDNIKRDLIGAKKAGMTTVWLNRNGAVENNDLKPDYQIEDLFQLKEFLGV
jgi:putative hydrolase of the HAD superfamily